MALTVLIVERVPESLRGDLSRWMLEPRACVFVGDLSAVVRDSLWSRACERSRAGACLLLHATNSEQGLSVRSFGDPSRTPVDLDGYTLISRTGGSRGPTGVRSNT